MHGLVLPIRGIACVTKSAMTFSTKSLSSATKFISKPNRYKGMTEFCLEKHDYDYRQEIARSAFADMLHDDDRNRKYYLGLEFAINTLRAKGKRVHVLDIGTGTGLLSMMAVRLGADRVTACETFLPVADCALHVLKDNAMEGKVHLIRKRSTEMTVGAGGDMTEKATLLVAEVFDTELIGEGALRTFKHAHEHLLEENAMTVPNSADVYVQVVSSKLLKAFKSLNPVRIKAATSLEGESGCLLQPPSAVTNCAGIPSVYDCQVSQLPADSLVYLSDPKRVFHFDFSHGSSALCLKRVNELDIVAKSDGTADAFIMWWKLGMDPWDYWQISCAPRWAEKKYFWRDHWMQGIYYPHTDLVLSKDDKVRLVAGHDEYSMWFDLIKPSLLPDSASKSVSETDVQHPICTCALHLHCNRTRFYQLNNKVWLDAYIAALKDVKVHSSTVICTSDGSLLPVVAAKLGAKHVYAIQTNHALRKFLQQYVNTNHVAEKITILDKEPLSQLPTKADILLGDPYYSYSLLPWDNLCFWFRREELDMNLKPTGSILPGRAVLRCVALDFHHLWKIRASVGIREGFNLAAFDNLVQPAIEDTDDLVEPQPLWEYPGIVMSLPTDIMNFQFEQYPRNLLSIGSVKIEMSGRCNGLAFWLDYQLGDHTISTGPTSPPSIGKTPDWNMGVRQGVYLFGPFKVVPGDSVEYEITFSSETGDVDFGFNFNFLDDLCKKLDGSYI